MGVGLAPGVLRSLLHPCRAGLCFCCLKPGTCGKETPELSPKNSLKACQKLFFFFLKQTVRIASLLFLLFILVLGAFC